MVALSVSAVRLAEPEDLPLLQAVETAADQRFAEVMDISAWGSSPHRTPTGAERATRGTLLVVGQPVLGFAHIVDLDGGRHLEALAVHPGAQGRGIGGSLLRSAYGVVADAGVDALTLTTFADVPWNGPWYAHHGFAPLSDPLPPALAALRADEHAAGLDDSGPRIAMSRRIVDAPTPVPAVSVLPVRDGPDGLEVFVQHRVATMDFVPDAVVFPGGRVDAGDAELGAALDLPAELLADHQRAWSATAHERLGDGPTATRILLATALREVEEETGARIDPTHLIPWDDWITPIGGKKRFDVRFFLLPVHGAGRTAEFGHTTTEAHRSEWALVEAVEAGAENGSLVLVAPTRILVEELAMLGSVSAAEGLRPQIVPVHHDLCPTPGRRGRLPADLSAGTPTGPRHAPSTP